MNTHLFEQVEQLAKKMMAAAEANDETLFYQDYETLKQLCDDQVGTRNEHPVLWESLADFTEDNSTAIALYQRAYDSAKALKETEYKASIQFSLAQRLLEQGERDEAKLALDKAAKFASYTDDDQLKLEISEMVNSLS